MGLSFLNSLTGSKTLDRRSNTQVINEINRGDAPPQNVYNLPAEWGLSRADAKIRYSMTGSYELPFGRGKRFLSSNRATDLAVGGWVINVVNVISTGYPLIITQPPNNNSSYFGGASQRPSATLFSPLTPRALGQRIDNRIKPAAFSTFPSLTYGHVGRTISQHGA